MRYKKYHVPSTIRWGWLCSMFVAWSCDVHSAQTLDQAIAEQLGNNCEVLLGAPGGGINGVPTTIGEYLASICVAAPGAPPPSAPSSTGGGGSTTQVASSILKRLRRQGSEEDSAEKEGGASGDFDFSLAQGFDVFLSADFEGLDRQITAFEDGYRSQIWGLTSGVDFAPTEWMRGGLAFNFNRWDADYLSRGGFQVDSYGPIVFASFYPVDQFYTDLVFSYARKDYSRNRFASFFEFGSVQASGDVTSKSSGDEFTAMIASGYDFNFDNFTIGPRVGFQYTELTIDGYTEQGSSGLELKYDEDKVESLKTTLGIRGSAAFGTNFGVVVPELNAAWVHEFMNDQRNIVVQFAQDFRANPTKFSYNNERPDRDYFTLGTGVSIILAHGIQPYVNFQALVGHSYFSDYVGTIGGRVEF